MLRFPRDLAVDGANRFLVADTYNHRIQVLDGTGVPLTLLGQAPGVGTLEKIVVDAKERVLAVDSDNGWVLAFLGVQAPKPFDLYVRDYRGDDGTEPSDKNQQVQSPDLLVRKGRATGLPLASLPSLRGPS